jgi:hypothetical protein
MKTLLLDIHGVLSYEGFRRRYRGAYGIGSELAARIRAIKKSAKAKMVLSSLARKPGNGRHVYRKVGESPALNLPPHHGGAGGERLHFRKRNLARQVFHAAVRRDGEPLRRHVSECGADARGDELGRLGV